MKPNPPHHAKSFLEIFSMTVSVSWTSFMSKWFTIQKIYSKMVSASCTDTHHDVITFKVDRMVENIKIWISPEQSVAFPWNWKNFLLCLKDYIFRNYHFFVEVITLTCSKNTVNESSTFNENSTLICWMLVRIWRKFARLYCFCSLLFSAKFTILIFRLQLWTRVFLTSALRRFNSWCAGFTTARNVDYRTGWIKSEHAFAGQPFHKKLSSYLLSEVKLCE